MRSSITLPAGDRMVQTRWTTERDYSMLTRLKPSCWTPICAGAGCPALGEFFNFNGTAACAGAGHRGRRRWQHDTLTEDTDLSYRSQMAGWKFNICPSGVPSELPSR